MKRTILLVLTAVMLAVAGFETAFAQANLNLLGARKQLDSDWEPVEQQDELGATFDISGEDWPFSISVWYLYATEKGSADTLLEQGDFDELEREAVTEEASVGIRKIWPNAGGWNYFLEGGATWVKASLDFTDVDSFDDSQVGWYGATGVYYTIINFINVGVFARYSDVQLDLVNEINAGGWHYGVLAGLHF